MPNQSHKLKQLLEKEEWTAEERVWLSNFLEGPGGGDVEQLMRECYLNDLQSRVTLDDGSGEKLLSRIHDAITSKKQQNRGGGGRTRLYSVAAALMIGFLATGSYFILETKERHGLKKSASGDRRFTNDVDPGGSKAILTLADGSAVLLEEIPDGTIAKQGSSRVVKTGGLVDYQNPGTGNTEVVYNSIATPRGGQYQVVLPDKTKVWLNAFSSIRFPTVFTGSQRKVAVTGELYFDVARNKAMPFIVSVRGSEISVVGTQFNVKSYGDEAEVETTLLEGAVRVSNEKSSALLKPGQQLKLSSTGKFKVLDHINVDRVLAWKNGFFDFEGLDFATLTKQLSRWYDVEVVYNKPVNDLFYAEIPRNTRLSDVLKALELTGKVHFDIEGKKVIVLP